jgi:hypothetical protein
MMERIRQEYALSEAKVSGFFRYRDIFQLLPAPKEAPSLDSIIGHHPCLLEFSYAVRDVAETRLNPSVPHIESTIDYDDSQKRRREVLLLLSTFCTSRVFQYSRSAIGSQSWFAPLGPGTDGLGKLYWGAQTYIQGLDRVVQGFSSASVPGIPLLEKNRYFGLDLPGVFVVGQSPEVLTMPDNVSALFDCFYSLGEEAGRVFLSSCFLLQKGLELDQSAPSLAFAACVSAIETLSSFDHREDEIVRCHNPECRQEIYHATRRFRELIERVNKNSPQEVGKFANEVYKRRSKILHRGQLTFGEIDPWTIENSIEALSESRVRKEAARFFRISLINWLVLEAGRASGQ